MCLDLMALSLNPPLLSHLNGVLELLPWMMNDDFSLLWLALKANGLRMLSCLQWGSIRWRWRHWSSYVLDTSLSVLQNVIFFIWDRCCYQIICLHQMEPHWCELGSIGRKSYVASLIWTTESSLCLDSQSPETSGGTNQVVEERGDLFHVLEGDAVAPLETIQTVEEGLQILKHRSRGSQQRLLNLKPLRGQPWLQ